MGVIVAAAGGGNWSAGGTWVGSVAPTAADDVTLTVTGGQVTVDGTDATTCVCRSLVCTGYTNTLTIASGKQLNIGDGTAGACTFVAGMTFAPNSASTLNFKSTTTGNNITSAGKTLGNITFDGVGGAWTLQDALAVNNGSTITLTNGSLDTNSKNIGASNGTGNPNSFSSSNSNTRSLTLGTTSFFIGNSSTTSSWNISTSTGMTLSAASSTIGFVLSTGIGTFSGGGLTYGTLTNATNLTTGNITINQANTFATATLQAGPGVSSSYIFSANQTVTGTLTGTGNSVINRTYYRSSVRGTQITLSAATFTMSNIDLQDMKFAGAGQPKDLSGSSSGNCGGNDSGVSITFTTPANQYWVPSGGTSTGSESAVTRWANASNGTAGTGRSPLPQDTAYFDGSSIDAGSRTITQDKPRIGAHIWTGATNTPAWTKSTACSFFGNITMISGMTNTASNNYTYEGRASSNFTSGTQAFTNALIVDCVSGTGTLVFADAFSGVATTLTSGTLDSITNSVTVGITSFTGTGGTFNVGNTVTGTSTFTINGYTLALGSYTFNAAGVVFTSGTITGTGTIAGTGAITFNGTGTTLNALSCTISGTTIALNGSGSTYNVKTVTGTGAITATTGTMNHTGTLTANSTALIVPPASSGNTIFSRIFTGY